MYKIAAIMGEAGSGKDTLLKRVLAADPALHEIVSCTTRPIREGEVEGVNYFYLTPEVFAEKMLENEFLEATCFNDWFYGTSYESLRSDCVNIGVFNPAGVESLLADPRVDVLVIYVWAKDKIRLLRQLNREEDPDVHEIIRRFKADWLDFDDLPFDYISMKNETIDDLQKCIDEVQDRIGQKWNI